MVRKNIFDLVYENYDVQAEIKKIYKSFHEAIYFCLDEGEGENEKCTDLTFKQLIEEHFFDRWKYKDTCLSLDEFFERANAKISDFDSEIPLDKIINILELLENFVKLFFDKQEWLSTHYHTFDFLEFDCDFCYMLDRLENHLGLTRKEFQDRVILYPTNPPLDKVVSIINDEDVQWELLNYIREDKSLSEKRKALAYLATNLYIEQDKKETDPTLIEVMDQATNVLNNLHIRHNNKTGKWEQKELLDSISEDEAISLCDFAFNQMLIIVLLRENIKYDDIYKKFNNIQKGGKKANG